MGRSGFTYWLSVLVVSSLFVGVVPAFGAQDETSFGYPLKNHTIQKPYSASASEYGPGHRGVDFFAPRGTAVFSIAQGQVIFAGAVAGFTYITIQHGDYKSTYSSMATKTVSVGDVVTKGQLIGTAAGFSLSSSTQTLFLSMRYKNKYVDPMLYISETQPAREIHLGELHAESDSLLTQLQAHEKKALTSFVNDVKDFATFSSRASKKIVEYMQKSTTDTVIVFKKFGSEAIGAYDEAMKTISEMKDVAKQIAQDSLDGAKKAVAAGKKKLAELEQKAITQMKKAIRLGVKLAKAYASAYQQALELGVDVATWFVQRMVMIPVLLAQLERDIIQGVYDAGLSAAHTTLKVLDQYFDVDWSTLARVMIIPASCLAYACTTAIKLACDPNSSFSVQTSSGGYRGSNNGVMFVSGLNSSGSPDVSADDKGAGKKVGQPVNFPWNALGYSPSDVSFYSYTGTGKSFETTDTYQDVHVSAERMDAQIKQWKIDHPNQKLDLITHSLGGNITALWIAQYYDPDDASYPDLGKIILYAPPLTGTSLASGGKIIDSDGDSRALHDDLNRIVGSEYIPPADAQSVTQVTEGGELAALLSKDEKLKKLDVHVIRSSSDIVASAASPHVDGVDEVIIDTDGAHLLGPITAHSDLTTDVASTSAAQHILEGKKVPCVSPTNAVNSVVKSATVHATEITVSRAARDISNAQDYSTVSKFMNSFN